MLLTILRITNIMAVSLLALLVMTSGCTSKVHTVDTIPVAVSPTDNPSDQIAELEKAFGESRLTDVPLLAPTWYQQAFESFTDAKQLREKSSDMVKIFKGLAEAKTELQKANDVAETSKKILHDVVQARDLAVTSQRAARAAGAVDLADLDEDFTKADQRLLILTAAVEKDDLRTVEEEKNSVISKYVQLQRNATKRETLDVVRRTIEEARQQKAKTYAPKSLEFAEETLKRAEKFIMENPNDRKAIEQQSAEATFYANRALRMTLEARYIAERKPEQIALGEEAEKTHLDRRAAFLAEEVERNRGPAETEGRMVQVRALFTPSEAEVLRDEANVILRLKSVKFEVGSAKLKTDNVALMPKVQRALELLGDNHVVVEGHTDSTGPEEFNTRLSQERAETVKTYLISKGAVSEDDIEAIGKGSMSPITTNKTKEGRAMNRRIDLIVSVSNHPNVQAAAE